MKGNQREPAQHKESEKLLFWWKKRKGNGKGMGPEEKKN